jgi:hypothetical protein
MTEGETLCLPAGTKLLAISFANDDEAKALAENIGAAKVLNKTNLSEELISSDSPRFPRRGTCLGHEWLYLQW